MKKSNLLFLFCCLLLQQIAYAQPEAAIWYFGTNAGLDFRQNPPKPLLDGQMGNVEGGTAICDAKGNLLFYTDGIKVWNKKHQIMTNGDSLMGNPSATQSGVVVPMPAHKGKYYVFTVDSEAGENGLRYSVVDMTKDTLGIIKEKNIKILSPTTEKITAVLHANGKDVWVLTHAWQSDEFNAYLLTSNGLNMTPVISKIGAVHGGDSGNSVGCMKVSPDGKKLALAIKILGFIEFFDFSTQTGFITNLLHFELGKDALAYGIEFSSDNTKLYVTAGGKHELYQVDLSSGIPDKIMASKQLIATNAVWSGCLQLAPDGKIYLALYDTQYLGVINKPNLLGAACEYKEKGIELAGRKSQINLPTFVQTYFDDRENLSKIQTNSGGFTKIGGSFYKNILFSLDKYDIRPEYYKDLDDLVTYLKLSSKVKVEITGHTDSDGLPQKNLLLSQNRAKAVENYIVAKGIDIGRLKSKGLGHTKPVAPNTTPAGKAQNRRIEFTLRK